MGFTVARQGGTKDIQFEEYTRLLHQQGLDLARLKRAPEPGSGRRWLHVWNSKPEAQAFADELKTCMDDPAWEVVEVNGKTSEGPLGPIEVDAARLIDGWTFALHPLSRLMIRRVFPESCRRSGVVIRTEFSKNFHSVQNDVAEVAEQVAIILTGLSLDKIVGTFGGYWVFDMKAKKELVAPAVGA